MVSKFLIDLLFLQSFLYKKMHQKDVIIFLALKGTEKTFSWRGQSSCEMLESAIFNIIVVQLQGLYSKILYILFIIYHKSFNFEPCILQ